MSSKIGELKGKTLLKSRTIVSIALSIVGFVVVNLLGLDVDLGAFVEAADGLQLGELILVIGGVIAAYFRKNARAGIPQSEG